MSNPVAWWNSLGRPLAKLPRWGALGILALLVATMAWSAWAVAPVDRAESTHAASTNTSGGDLALYARISERVAAGEGYYHAAMDEQRARNYPTRPFVAVRLPTMAWLHGVIGVNGVRALAALLLLANLVALYRRLAGQATHRERIGALVMLALGGAAVAAPQGGLVHEVLAGQLLTLALLLRSPQRWWPSLLLAALALAVRELAVPFVLLWLAFAVIERRWREAGAVAALLLVFAGGMVLHYLAVEAQRLPGDPLSQGWAGMIGPALPLMALSRLTALLVLPKWLAAHLAVLPLLGWLGLGGRTGLFATVWFAGFLTAMALFARPENFYWAQLVLPAYFAGLALAPRALTELAVKGFGPRERQT
jgi:hypothetical protein